MLNFWLDGKTNVQNILVKLKREVLVLSFYLKTCYFVAS